LRTPVRLALVFAVLISALGGIAAQHAAAQDVTLKVVGFKVVPEEQGTPLDQAYQKFLADFQTANPGVSVDAIETPPEFDTQLIVDLASGTAPDVWQQDASTLAPLVDGGYVLDMNKCVELVPELNLDRFFPNVLAIHQREDGAIYNLPNDFTPMVIYYNPQTFEKAGVAVPAEGWTWDDLLSTAQQLTIDKNGKNALDPAFDKDNVAQWGFRVRKDAFEWIYRVWQNGGDVISPDGTTATGYLDSPQAIEAIQFQQDLVLKYHVAPEPSTLDSLTQSVAFNDRFLKGEFAMFDRGHWELVGLESNANYTEGSIGIVGQPSKVDGSTVIYESSWAIRGDLEGDKLLAACKFVTAATDRQYQDTKALTGVAIAANQESAAAAIDSSKTPELERVFQAEVADGRAPYGAKYAKWPAVEEILNSMMERILAGGNVNDEVAGAVEEINRELSAQ
jgi:multiple sugar transport system substrate-binding protein